MSKLLTHTVHVCWHWSVSISTTGQKADLIKRITNPINGYSLFPSFSLHLSSTCFISLSFPPFTSFHVHLSTSCLPFFPHVSLYVFHSSSACPALRFSPANHMDVFIAFIQTNKQITLQMVIDMHINQLCLLNKKVFKLTCQDILHLKVSCSVYALLLKVMVKVTLHSVDEIRQVCCVIWFSSLLLTKLSLDSTHISSANNKSETSLTQWKLI